MSMTTASATAAASASASAYTYDLTSAYQPRDVYQRRRRWAAPQRQLPSLELPASRNS
jgi:hypothetical protein